MIGTVSRVDSAGVYVTGLGSLPGVELGPLPALVHRYLDKWQADSGTGTPGAVSTDTKFTAYAAGDRVLVLEHRANEFVVHGIVTGG